MPAGGGLVDRPSSPALGDASAFHLVCELTELGQPILIGTSRKSFIGKLLDLTVHDRIEGTAATVTAAIMHGADIVRMHDVRFMTRVARVTDRIARDAQNALRASD